MLFLFSLLLILSKLEQGIFGPWHSHALFQNILSDFYAVFISHETIQVRTTVLCEPATTGHLHEYLQANVHSEPSSQNISNASDLWGMGTEGQPVSQVPSAIYQTEEAMLP